MTSVYRGLRHWQQEQQQALGRQKVECPTTFLQTLPGWISTVSGQFGDDDTCQLCGLFLQTIIQKIVQLSDQDPIHVETKMALVICQSHSIFNSSTIINIDLYAEWSNYNEYLQYNLYLYYKVKYTWTYILHVVCWFQDLSLLCLQ